MSVQRCLAKRFRDFFSLCRQWALSTSARVYRALPVIFVIMASTLVGGASTGLVLAAILVEKLTQLVGLALTIQILKAALEVFIMALGFLITALRYHFEMHRKHGKHPEYVMEEQPTEVQTVLKRANDFSGKKN